ncbi:FAD-dependent oxidoreductase [Chryseosolibacter indicus]|uniref:FAD-dependent oxidoreductase n=1 Tax=Chryseosolibacter indicus TaxID=2782351 RepID=A0ABS5VM67_9BACT|nr:FAD-dependent oxidoreductase [Chryseosolibacter indicus]MBT1702555.1 FAD-dependent oxidoreductase [Chryseosolibacter indicus]
MSQQIISGTNQQSGVLTSGANISYWIDSAEPILFTPLNEDLLTDVVVVGGGISGLSIAYCLCKAGRSVVVIEDGAIGSGETGRTTAHIVNALDDRYSEIESMLGEQESRLAADSHTAAINFIERVVKEENIDCDFKRIDGYLFLHPSDEIKTLEEELDATRRAGIPTELLPNVPGGIHAMGPSLRFPSQAQFHPMKYLKGLADAVIRLGGRIYTETRATEFKQQIVVANDHTLTANYVVVATNTPVNDIVTMHTKQHPYRTYVIGALVPKGMLEYSLWWDSGDMDSKWVTDPYHYARLQPYNEQFDLLIVGGEDHKTGQAEEENIPEENRYSNLISWTQQHFPQVIDIVYHWSGQVMEPVDALAFIGKNPGDKSTYIATGDSGNGMTHGTISGMLIADLIQGIENPWEKIYDPSRITAKATKEYLTEVSNMTVQYLDYLSPGDIKTINELEPNQGAIMNLGVKKAAVYRDEKNVLHTYSAICPHLGCVVQWNGSEKSFDCPCHGSRFTTEGKVVNGPAKSDLKKIVIN